MSANYGPPNVKIISSEYSGREVPEGFIHGRKDGIMGKLNILFPNPDSDTWLCGLKLFNLTALQFPQIKNFKKLLQKGALKSQYQVNTKHLTYFRAFLYYIL